MSSTWSPLPTTTTKTTATESPLLPSDTTTPTDTSFPRPSPTTRVVRAAVIYFGFENDPISAYANLPQNGSLFRDAIMKGDAAAAMGVAEFMDKYMDGRYQFRGVLEPGQPADALGPIALPRRNDDNCDVNGWKSTALQMAGRWYSDYDMVMFFASSGPRCPFIGSGEKRERERKEPFV